MWFKNLRIYKLSDKLETNADTFSAALEEFKFTPCAAQSAISTGFTKPFKKASENYAHKVGDKIVFAIKCQEKILPASVIADECQPKFESLEQEKGRPLSRKEKQAIKDEVSQSLLPRAFNRSKTTVGYYDAKNDLIVIDSASANQAEDVLALLRKALGSLPALPWLDAHKLTTLLQEWVQGKGIPTNMNLGCDAEFKAPDEEGAKASFKNQLLSAPDVQGHLQDKLVTQIGLDLTENASFMIDDCGAIKRLKFHDILVSTNEELGWEDQTARIEADFAIMTSAIDTITDSIGKLASHSK